MTNYVIWWRFRRNCYHLVKPIIDTYLSVSQTETNLLVCDLSGTSARRTILLPPHHPGRLTGPINGSRDRKCIFRPWWLQSGAKVSLKFNFVFFPSTVLITMKRRAQNTDIHDTYLINTWQIEGSSRHVYYSHRHSWKNTKSNRKIMY